MKSTSKTEIAAPSVPGRAQGLALFGPPLLLEGEDAAAYDQLLVRINAAVKPLDIIDEMFIADVVSLEWEVLRWRRLKSSVIRACGLKALEGFLAEQLENHYGLYADHFANHLAEILQKKFPEYEPDYLQTLANQSARNEPDADYKVEELLLVMHRDVDDILRGARARKAKELLQEYRRREPDAVRLIDELLTGAGMSMDALLTDALSLRLDSIERTDRLATIAENRRNASLHEIERRHAVLGATLRRSVQEIEDGEFEEIETTPAQGKNVA